MKIPEPIRVAHLIAGGIVTGESKGKALLYNSFLRRGSLKIQ